jgi:hypothetical protein
MYPETTDDFIDAYGMFLEASAILTKEQYFMKVLFNSKALNSIQSSEFEPRISYEINKEDAGTISFNFGDLLSKVPVSERLKWKQYYKGIRITADLPIDEAYKLLFFDIENGRELRTIKDYWRKKTIDSLESEVSGDEPWYTAQEREQSFKRSRYLNQIDPKTGRWKDLESIMFKPEVLDKYKNNELCSIESDKISFLRHDKTPASIALFNILNNNLMMFEKEFKHIPPIERGHWISYQIHRDAADSSNDSST